MKTSLDGLIDESVTIIREVAAEFERPVLLFSGGKDSVVMLHLAVRAFAPARIPFPVMHIDTGHNFPEVIEFRDRCVSEMGVQLIVGSVQASIDSGKVADVTGPRASRNPLQTVTLLDSIAEHRFDAVFGGARRDEERARAKERVYSHRDSFGQWDPKNQRPELWGIYNGRHRQGEHFRIFPLSNWTELDIWTFIGEYNIDLPSIYYAHTRPIFKRDNMLMAVTDFLPPDEGAVVEQMQVRFRTVGDATCTAAVSSGASTVDDIIAETAVARVTERGATRADDRMSEAGMEDRKRTGYFKWNACALPLLVR
jgi:sulfate adenylyltransferase subunit 2